MLYFIFFVCFLYIDLTWD